MPTKKITKKSPAKKVAKKATKKVAKKTVKKAAKSTLKPKTQNKSKKVKPLRYADNQTSFWVTDGRILNSLVALRDALSEMEDEVYQYHAQGTYNDFANWVAVVLCDEACARDLEKAKTPRSAKTVVVKHLKAYAV